MINSFRGEYFYLSNMYPCKVRYDGLEFRCAEAAFQAAKLENREERVRFTFMDGYESKREGRKVKLRSNWNNIRFNIMGKILFNKFIGNPDIALKLIRTGDEILVEGNNWGDKYWGVVNGVGENNLGMLLMRLRKYLKDNMGRG